MRLKQLETLIESSKKHALFEGVKIGKKEIEETLNNSTDFQMGIEYEFLLPQPIDGSMRSIEQANKFITDNNIKHVDKVVHEHDSMNEVITAVMPIPTGINHIKDFFDKAIANGITFPSTAGLHISISHKHYDKKDINLTKFLVLLSGDYLHSIFPVRRFVQNISDRMHDALQGYTKPSIKEMERVIQDEFTSRPEDDDSTKYITAKISDYITMDGRIELRFVGGENYNEQFDEIRWQVLRAVYILAIAYEPEMFRNEYLKTLYSYTQLKKLPNDYDPSHIQPRRAVEMAKKYDDPRLIDVIATDAEASLVYAVAVLRGRFKQGENIIATDARASYSYASRVLKRRFKRGEPAIALDADESVSYALDILKGRFERGEDVIATDARASYAYAKEVMNGRFEKGEEVITNSKLYAPMYAKLINQGATAPPRKQTLDDILDDLSDSDLFDL